MLHYMAFHLGLHCLQKYTLRGFTVYKGLNSYNRQTNHGIIMHQSFVTDAPPPHTHWNGPVIAEIISRAITSGVLYTITQVYPKEFIIVWAMPQENLSSGLRTTQGQTSLCIPSD